MAVCNGRFGQSRAGVPAFAAVDGSSRMSRVSHWASASS
jgi:hypothetical protein